MVGHDFPGKGKVAVLRTRPETVVDDIGRLMEMAGYREALPQDRETILKVNISWQTWYPACSSTPWQIEGVVTRAAGRRLSQTWPRRTTRRSWSTPTSAERNNKQKHVVDKYGVRNVHLYEPEIEWVRYTPKAPMLVLDQIFPEGILIPEFFFDSNIIHLPTVKTHVFTTITGAMKNAFGGLLQREAPLDARRHPRNRGRPARDPAGDPQRPVRGDGRHLRGRRPGPARDALAREGHLAGLGRPGRHRRDLRQAAGLRPDGA